MVRKGECRGGERINPFSVCALVEVSLCPLCPGHPLAVLPSSDRNGPSEDLNIIDDDTIVTYCSLSVALSSD